MTDKQKGKPDSYWLARMELIFMQMLSGPVRLQPYRKVIGRMIERAFVQVLDEQEKGIRYDRPEKR